MIPGSFEYHRPDSVASALEILAEYGDEARAIAGGHSLIPMMKLRMADVGHLVDLQAIADLKGITVQGDTIIIGAMTTQQELISSAELASAAPILREASLQIADPQVRYVGTIGGNVANGDPGNDLPGLMQCLDAQYTLAGRDGTREVAARDFYEAAYFTAREDDEILVSIKFRATTGGYAYEKQKRKIGDYATAAAAVLIAKDGATCSFASIAMTNLSDTPVWCEAAADALVGSSLDQAAIDAAVAAMLETIDPQEDNRGPVEFKNHVAGVILRRAIERAASRA
ncbi:FAD binding domain-containing protein [Oricola cellulosilytica]|uniref:Xanthine dehydrogenase family protein subunit M n=1 Tax=Oricola cellulosilytica TaxID=1429082 RepID=A0A4R0P4N9_9HYPH|nr:xanthine dehydrogenase family protein subunit M [Oricola cellulosilytica]TCD11842.1 xanthine dehydrogenase family protein subunit M [Oricola cellulosilytica]